MSIVLPALQRADPLASSAVAPYLAATASVCPFIEPAVAAGCLHFCQIKPDCQAEADIHPRVFEQMVPLIERFRDDRRALPDAQQRLLICHAVVIDLPVALDAPAVRLLEWPNWLGLLLKQIYTPKEIVFGFIRKNVATQSRFGQPIPVAPFHAIVIRSRVPNSDHRFFPGNQPLLRAMMEADDDGRDAHAALVPDVPNLRDPEALRKADYFRRLRQWGQAQFAARR
jgi:hypothetical protein